MPTILLILGWRLYFFSQEGNEPIHIHAEKGGMKCKFWLHTDTFEISEASSLKLKKTARREIRKIIYQHFDLIVDEWNTYFKK